MGLVDRLVSGRIKDSGKFSDIKESFLTEMKSLDEVHITIKSVYTDILLEDIVYNDTNYNSEEKDGVSAFEFLSSELMKRCLRIEKTPFKYECREKNNVKTMSLYAGTRDVPPAEYHKIQIKLYSK